jgi:hypothetical protein
MVPMIIIVIVDGSGTSEIGENAAENGELPRPLPADPRSRISLGLESSRCRRPLSSPRSQFLRPRRIAKRTARRFCASRATSSSLKRNR